MSIQAIQINNDGICSSRQIQQKNDAFVYNNVQLHIHYQGSEFLVLSPESILDVLKPDVELFQFSLPPPLNSYIYPKTVFVIKLKNCSIPEDVTCNEFLEYCAKFKAEMSEQKLDLAVYDVPLDDAIYDNDEESEHEEEEYDASDEEQDNELEDDEWDEDDEPIIS